MLIKNSIHLFVNIVLELQSSTEGVDGLNDFKCIIAIISDITATLEVYILHTYGSARVFTLLIGQQLLATPHTPSL